MILWLVLGLRSNERNMVWGSMLLLWVLLALLGWNAFGPALHK